MSDVKCDVISINQNVNKNVQPNRVVIRFLSRNPTSRNYGCNNSPQEYLRGPLEFRSGPQILQMFLLSKGKVGRHESLGDNKHVHTLLH
jgi:hypothetical protein